jgi:hypothetical protein
MEVSMNVNEYDLKRDRTEENNAIAALYLFPILEKVNKLGQVTCFDLYVNNDFSDIPLYLALHTLVKTNLIQGNSPYAVDEDGDVLATKMTEMVFRSVDYVCPRDVVPSHLAFA